MNSVAVKPVQPRKTEKPILKTAVATGVGALGGCVAYDFKYGKASKIAKEGFDTFKANHIKAGFEKLATKNGISLEEATKKFVRSKGGFATDAKNKFKPFQELYEASKGKLPKYAAIGAAAVGVTYLLAKALFGKKATTQG